MNIGSCETARLERQYGLIARLEYLTRFSTESKNTFLKYFENYYPEDEDEILQEDIKKTWNLEGDAPTTPKTSQGRIAESLLDKKQTRHFFALLTPLSSFQCLILPQVDIGKQHFDLWTDRQTDKQLTADSSEQRMADGGLRTTDNK